jgi:hypothetical protein
MKEPIATTHDWGTLHTNMGRVDKALISGQQIGWHWIYTRTNPTVYFFKITYDSLLNERACISDGWGGETEKHLLVNLVV